MMTMQRDGDRLLTPGEVASLFRVDPKTVTRWAKAGRVTRVRTPGGHSRFWESEVQALLVADEAPDPQAGRIAALVGEGLTPAQAVAHVAKEG